MRFNSFTLGALLALSASEVLGLAIGPELQSRHIRNIEKRAPPPDWAFKTVPGSTSDKFLAVDVFTVGYLTADGNYKISNYQNEKTKAEGTLELKDRRIGTNSLTICSLFMIVSRKGALMTHLNPITCEMFLKPNKSKDEIKKDKADKNYAQEKKMFEAFKKKCRSLAGEFQKMAGGSKVPVVAMMVRGPYQQDDKYGKWIASEIFGISNPAVSFLEAPKSGQGETATSRFVVADFTTTNPTLSIGGTIVNSNLP